MNATLNKICISWTEFIARKTGREETRRGQTGLSMPVTFVLYFVFILPRHRFVNCLCSNDHGSTNNAKVLALQKPDINLEAYWTESEKRQEDTLFVADKRVPNGHGIWLFSRISLPSASLTHPQMSFFLKNSSTLEVF